MRHYETTKEHAERIGAIAFFGDKYGDLVRVLEAGDHSIELCGGTHVHALGFIGPIKIVSEGSIGANLRRIEAVTGDGALDRIHDEEVQLRGLADDAAGQRRPSCPTASSGCSQQVKELQDELAAARGRARRRAEAADAGGERAATASVVARRDGLDPDELRRLAHRDPRRARLRDRRRWSASAPDGGKAGIAVAVTQGPGRRAARRRPTSRATRRRRSAAARPRTPTSSGRRAERRREVDEALSLVRRQARGRRQRVAADGGAGAHGTSPRRRSRLTPDRTGALRSGRARREPARHDRAKRRPCRRPSEDPRLGARS